MYLIDLGWVDSHDGKGFTEKVERAFGLGLLGATLGGSIGEGKDMELSWLVSWPKPACSAFWLFRCGWTMVEMRASFIVRGSTCDVAKNAYLFIFLFSCSCDDISPSQKEVGAMTDVHVCEEATMRPVSQQIDKSRSWFWYLSN